jgi:hypothetical protein
VPQSVALTEDDDGEASELIDFWSLDNTNKLPKGALKKLGYKIVKNEESGEWEAVKRVSIKLSAWRREVCNYKSLLSVRFCKE